MKLSTLVGRLKEKIRGRKKDDPSKKKKLSPVELEEDIYDKKNFPINRMIIFTIVLILVGFTLHLPLKELIVSKIESKLAKLRSCPISYKEIQIEFLLPKIIISSPQISGMCFRKPGSNIRLDQIEATLLGPSFSPFGLKLKLAGKGKDLNLLAYSSIGINEQVLKIEETTIGKNFLEQLTKSQFNLNGTFEIEALVKASRQRVKDSHFYIKSKTFALPAQTIGGIFNLPRLRLGNISLKGVYDGKDALNINEFILGNKNSPVVANLSGQISSLRNSPKYEFNGNLKLGDQVTKDPALSILNLLFAKGKVHEDGFYHLSISGKANAGMPKLKFQ